MSGRVKKTERLINGVTGQQAKDADRLEPKRHRGGQRLFCGLSRGQKTPPADRADLTHSVFYRETVGANRYADRKIVTGTLQDLIDGAEAFLNRYIAVGARIEGWKRIDIPEYSLEVLREAAINAVVHRDYSKRGESIRVLYYPDRVEIHSPGLLLPGITVEQRERGEVQSKLRNPVLAGLLRDIPGYRERIGSGIRFMLDETKRLRLPAPQFREAGEFIVTFHKGHALMPPPAKPPERATLWEDYEAAQPEVPVQTLPDERESRLIKGWIMYMSMGLLPIGCIGI